LAFPARAALCSVWRRGIRAVRITVRQRQYPLSDAALQDLQHHYS